ncbi:hypothetical protein POM88_028863 [Heracleum sosnowskyi]|uniref:BED-type domain-containing protein n=1 Tax=Heracleum sosnowskyi TaxID=360622 RepID=A0AAD8HV49_9APIA|nr:hypothetical protein POM88_028863 [Heracleum sosnowskyi]
MRRRDSSSLLPLDLEIERTAKQIRKQVREAKTQFGTMGDNVNEVPAARRLRVKEYIMPSFDGIYSTKMVSQFEALNKKLESLSLDRHQPVHPAQQVQNVHVFCDTCGEGHLTQQCPLIYHDASQSDTVMDQFFTDANEMEDVIFSPPNPTPNPTPNTIPNPTPNTTPNTPPNPTLDSTTPNPTPNTTPTELKSPKKEGDEQLTNKNKTTRTSNVWAHFKKVTSGDPNNPRCKCNYCGADYACHSTRVGTSSLWVHLRKCKKHPGRASDKKQKVLSFKKEIGGGSNLLAVTFNKAFTRYEEEDDKFVSYFMEKENGKKRMGPPTATDWHAASIFVKFLATFYEVILKFSSTLHVTSNNFYHEICEFHTLLTDLAASRGPLLSSMAGSMKEKYDKYWGDAEDINPLLFLVVVLGPRYKMGYLKYCFESVYDAESVARIVTKVESLLQRMYAAYDGQGSDGDGSNSKVYQSNTPLNVGDGINKRKITGKLLASAENGEY